MKRIYSFKCTHCGNAFDELTEYTATHECPQCGAVAEKVIIPPQIHLEGTTGSFPGAAISWERKRNNKINQERKQQE